MNGVDEYTFRFLPLYLPGCSLPSMDTASSQTFFRFLIGIAVLSSEGTAVYSEAEDNSPRAIPVADFANYYKNKAENDSVKLREEFMVRRF